MRKVTFGGANSLDNFFARKDDTVDWLLWSKEVQQIMKDYWKNIDTVVMGRRTYEVADKDGRRRRAVVQVSRLTSSRERSKNEATRI